MKFKKAECEEAVEYHGYKKSNCNCCVSFQSPNTSIDENQKIQNAIKEVSKRDCISMEDFNHAGIP